MNNPRDQEPHEPDELREPYEPLESSEPSEPREPWLCVVGAIGLEPMTSCV
jgi:hypothetical protein